MTDQNHMIAALVAYAAAHPEIERRLLEMEEAVGAITVTAHPEGVALHGYLETGLEVHEWMELGPGWDSLPTAEPQVPSST